MSALACLGISMRRIESSIWMSFSAISRMLIIRKCMTALQKESKLFRRIMPLTYCINGNKAQHTTMFK